MLCLSRKKGESIRVADNIEIRVLCVHGNRVTLGVEAPQEIPVVRTTFETRPDEKVGLGDFVKARAKHPRGTVPGGREAA